MIARISTLRDICAEMSGIRIPFERIETRFLEEIYRRNGKGIDLGQLTGKLAEIHTLERIEELERRHSETVRVYWLREKTKREEKEYAPASDGTPNIVVYNSKNKEPIGEIDMVIFVKGIPVIVETHIGKFNCSQRAGVEQVVSHDAVSRKKKHIAGLFGKHPEIVYVIPENYVMNVQKSESRLAQYVKAGNYLVAFPMDRHAWRALAESVVFSKVV